jgi:heavy metal translocating P-type ATPase
MKQADFRVAGLDCENEASAIERGLRGISGISDLKVYVKSAKVGVTFDPALISAEAVKDKLQELGFPVQEGRALARQPKPWRNPKVIAAVTSGVLLVIGYILGVFGTLPWISAGCYIAAILIGGYYFVKEAIEELIFDRQVGIEFLMSTAALAASLLGELGEAAMLVFLYSISEAAEGYTEEKTRSAIRALMDLTPKQALVRRDGRETEIPVEELQVDDIFIVKPGQAIATDGEVLIGLSSVNQAPVTGESVPVEKQPGDTVFSGTINGEGALEIRATKTVADNTIARIINMVEEAQEKKGKSQRFIERFGSRYSPAVLAAGVLIAIVPPLVAAVPWLVWITRATVFIVAAAPCALAISIPITLVASLGTAARQGVLIKGGLYVEELARVTVVALDKTGTITRGEPKVTEIVPHEGTEATGSSGFVAVAAGIEKWSQHPLAKAVVLYAAQQNIIPAEVTGFRSLTGSGAQGLWNGSTMYVGSPEFFRTKRRVDITSLDARIELLQQQGKTVILVGSEQRVLGLIAIADTIRPNAAEAIRALHAVGIDKVVMLTGDNKRTAEAIARLAGIDEVYADLKPEDKAAKVRELAKRYGHVAMVGDGVNDAPALAEATVGVAMGAAGTDVALETADVALMADDLDKLVYALRLARRNQTVVRQNLVLSSVVISVLVVGAISGFLSLPIAVLGHEISEFIVIGSGLRMLRA